MITSYLFNFGKKSTIECVLEYVSSEKGHRENGVQIQPDYPASMILISAIHGDSDIYELLDEKTISKIEFLALEDFEK